MTSHFAGYRDIMPKGKELAQQSFSTQIATSTCKTAALPGFRAAADHGHDLTDRSSSLMEHHRKIGRYASGNEIDQSPGSTA